MSTYRSVTLSSEPETLPTCDGNQPCAVPPKRAAERILDVAEELFYREGIRAVGIEEIVREAGVTKPSLYRAFASKDDLAAAYLKRYDVAFWERFAAAEAEFPDDPRAQVLAFFGRVERRAARPASRGCGLTNAAAEFADEAHPARLVCIASKAALRQRLREKALAMGASDAEGLGDGLMMLFEGANAGTHAFPENRPAASLVRAAEWLIRGALAAQD